jgi:hypothetical protein
LHNARRKRGYVFIWLYFSAAEVQELIIDHKAAFVTYVTAGYPTEGETVDIMLSMQAGGAGSCPS